MLIDRTHKKWAVGCAAACAVAAAAYLPYHLWSPEGPRGGSLMGLTYGITGYALMLIAGVLGLRKRFLTLRIGKIQHWMRAHLWLGALSLPLIVLHSGFAWGGTFTTVLMALAIVVALSGVCGAALQHYLPALMTIQVPMETVYEQIPSIRKQLSAEADWIIANQEAQAAEKLELELQAALDPALPKTFRLAARMDASAKLDQKETVFMSQPAPKSTESLRSFYAMEIMPFLEQPHDRVHALGVAEGSQLRFDQIRTLLPASHHEAVNDLENICEEARQLNRQEKMHHWLHVWLLLHVPLSYALLLLGAVHAAVALLY